MESLELEIKHMLIEELALEDITPDDLGSEMQLFAEDGLGLDSIDALEIGVAIQNRYNIKFDEQDDAIREHFATVKQLAALIQQMQSPS
jgi:acyl carrier protein